MHFQSRAYIFLNKIYSVRYTLRRPAIKFRLIVAYLRNILFSNGGCRYFLNYKTLITDKDALIIRPYSIFSVFIRKCDSNNEDDNANSKADALKPMMAAR